LERRSSQFVQYHILDVVVRTLAPILPHFTEEIFQHLTDLSTKKGTTVFCIVFFPLCVLQ
jgi:isoleucyl-tRNA synthetase